MLGKIERILNNKIYLKMNFEPDKVQSLLNLYVLIQDNQDSYIGEIESIDKNIATISLLGEYKNNDIITGSIKKPAFSSKVDLIAPKYLENIISYKEDKYQTLNLGYSPIYSDIKINLNVNKFFGSHFAIFGSTGSGKSCSFARMIQNLIHKDNLSEKVNLVIFDAYGEYSQAFNILNQTGKYAFKMYTSDVNDPQNMITIPIWHLTIDDYALLLGVTKPAQMPIIEKMLRNVSLFKRPEEEVSRYKNSIIASALLDIIQSGRPAPQIRDQFITALSKYYTKELNLESQITQPGYIRTLRQCLLIDDKNKINAIELVTSFLEKFLITDVYTTLPDGSFSYTLKDVLDALEFALIDEGIWKSEKIFDDANILKVRLNGLLNSDKSKYLSYPEYISKEDYIKKLFTTFTGQKAQIINFNINGLDDNFSKVIVKIYSKLFFEYAKHLKDRASMPFNIILEEAHRYVQNDDDKEILGYNIFERISKEGRKYGVLLGLISQRPCELSETCLSQCNNFLLFKMTHPVDIEYISKVVPFITDEIIEKMKTVLPGNAIVFGTSFKLATLVKFEMPSPSPNSDNCEISALWFK